jgi:hypothetical protein
MGFRFLFGKARSIASSRAMVFVLGVDYARASRMTVAR